jgi:O-antigen/teichoic acid export membrane protein
MSFFKKGFNKSSRSTNVLRNMNVAFICELMNTLLGFVSRSVFIAMLGKSYLGVGGIFHNILKLLSLTELGFGTAIVYNLYKPIRNHEEQTITNLMWFYRKAYFCIGFAVLTMGLILLPFLKLLIKNPPNIPENITLLYLLHLASSVSSYYLAHKRCILSADQKGYIAGIYTQVFHTARILLQMLALYLTKNYTLYLCISIARHLSHTIWIAHVVDKLYPFLTQLKPQKLPAEFFQKLKKDISALFLYKINRVIIHGTDNLLIAAIAKNGVVAVGLYSNYLLISETANMVLGIITSSFTSSLGNLNASDEDSKKEKVFYCILFLSAWLYGYVCSGIFELSDRFIELWLNKEYILGPLVVFAIVLQLYIRSVHYAAYAYRITNGLFVQSKYVPLFTSFVNIALSIWWGKLWGLFGILFATSIARIVTIGIVDPYLVYKYVFNKGVLPYYITYIKYTVVTLAAMFIAKNAILLIPLHGWLGFIVDFIVYSLLFNGIFMLVFFRTEERKYLTNIAMSLFKKHLPKLAAKFA